MMAQSDEVWSESSENDGQLSTASEKEQDDFPQPSPKRLRISRDDNDSGSRHLQYSAPSRIKQAISQIKAKVDDPPLISAPSTPSTLTTSTFESLNVAPWLIHSLRSMAITNPTEIQRSCIPEILQGRDCIGGSKTGTGKTVAFAVPILQKWAEDPFGIYAVIITPTRELALQIYEQFLALGSPQSLKVVLITGGSDMRPQALALSQRPHIVVATPGRLADHIQTSGKETTIGLTRAKVVVLDEADRLLASGPGSMLPDLNTCLSALPPSSSRNTLLFTATVTTEVRALQSLPRPPNGPPIFVSEINSPSSDTSSNTLLVPSTLTQTYLQVPLTQKDVFLHVLLLTPSFNPAKYPPSIIIFTNRTTTADILHRTLLTLQHPVTSLHSLLPQSQRNRNLASFRALKTRILIATDVASRGLDVPEVGIVVNYDVPRNPADYVHRVGRTARAGKEGLSVTFVSQRDVSLVLGIEEYVGGSGSTASTSTSGAGAEAAESESRGASHPPPPQTNISDPQPSSTGASVIPKNQTHRTPSDVNSHSRSAGEENTKPNAEHNTTPTPTAKAIPPSPARMLPWTEEGVNIESRVIKGRVLKDVAEARMEAVREVEQGRDINGWRRGVIKKKRR